MKLIPLIAFIFIVSTQKVLSAFPNTPLLDDFNRTDESPLAGGWGGSVFNASNLKIVSNLAAGITGGGTANSQGWGTKMGVGTVECYATYTTFENANVNMVLYVRVSTLAVPTTSTGYGCYFNDSQDKINVYRVSAGPSFTQLGTTFNIDMSAGDICGVDQQNDTNGTITVYVNGSAVTTRTDTTHKGAEGYIGMRIDGMVIRADDFGGGLVGAASAGAVVNSYPRTGRRATIVGGVR